MWDTSSDEEDEYIPQQRQRRLFRMGTNCEFTSMFEFNERFRISSISLESLLNDIGHRLHHPTNRSNALPARLQLCVALHWFGTGGQYHSVGDMHGISKASVCRAVHAVVNAVNEIKFSEVVEWPENVIGVAAKFYNNAKHIKRVVDIPNVIGCVDGTLINIDAPHLNEVQYVDRHGNHSLNCMVVCGPDCTFYYVSARWPGSDHDSRVLRNSTLTRRMDEGWRPIPNAIILADSGYPLKEWLIPPATRDLQDPAVIRFNRAHRSTRRIVENSLGILKEKFPCLNYLRLEPILAAEVFKCCTALCNIARNEEDVQLPNIPENLDNREEEEGEENDNSQPPNTASQQRMVQLLDCFR